MIGQIIGIPIVLSMIGASLFLFRGIEERERRFLRSIYCQTAQLHFPDKNSCQITKKKIVILNLKGNLANESERPLSTYQ